jgi:hypothetical protein
MAGAAGAAYLFSSVLIPAFSPRRRRIVAIFVEIPATGLAG